MGSILIGLVANVKLHDNSQPTKKKVKYYKHKYLEIFLHSI